MPTEKQEPAVRIDKDILPIDLKKMNDPKGYVAWDEDLIHASNVARALGKPLLLTGEAGVGKSEFARYLAHELGFAGIEKYVIKSTTEATDLFYRYDTLGRFHHAQIANFDSQKLVESVQSKRNHTDPRTFITYQALGKAILYSVGYDKALEEGFISDAMDNKFLNDFPKQPRQTIVLIDEIDKAPRDVPNDILDEIDKMAFKVPEIGVDSLESNQIFRPVVVITSNSERDLPEPFLRRCIFYHIPFPSQEIHLRKIVLSRLCKSIAEFSPLLADAQKMLDYLRSDKITLQRKPGIAEFLDWVIELERSADQTVDSRLYNHPKAYILAKNDTVETFPGPD
jgi:MoxR-like ATPase